MKQQASSAAGQMMIVYIFFVCTYQDLEKASTNYDIFRSAHY